MPRGDPEAPYQSGRRRPQHQGAGGEQLSSREEFDKPSALRDLLARGSLEALADDPPASVGLTAGGAEGVLRPAANGYGLLVLSAKAAVGLERADRRDRTRMSAVGIGP